MCWVGSPLSSLEQRADMIRRIVKMASLWFPAAGYDVVRVLLGILLLVAALLKTHQLATEPLPGITILESRWLLVPIVEFEILFGLMFLAGMHKRLTWGLGIVCFGLFAAVSFYKGVSGATSCGCWGRVRVSPWLTMAVDTASVVALLYSAPNGQPCARLGRQTGPSRLVDWLVSDTPCTNGRWVVFWIAWSLAAVAPMVLISRAWGAVADIGIVSNDGKTVVLEPDRWLGKKLPILPYVGVGEKLDTGTWTLVLYHHDCHKCQAFLANYANFVREHQTDRMRRHSALALIEVPPFDESDTFRLPRDLTDAGHGRLSESRKWFVETPVAIYLSNGVVRAVNTGVDAVRI